MRKTLFLMLALPISILAQNLPYTDTSFNGYGRVSLEVWNNNYTECTIVQPDKKILVGGSTHMNDPNIKSSPLIARYNENGTIDSSFGSNGLVYDANGPGGTISEIRVLPDGKLLIAGRWDYYAFIGRLLPNGSFDTSFGNDGKVNIPGITIRKIDILPDGSIIGLGTGDWSSKLVKISADGQIDNTFGTNGEVPTNIGFSKIIGNAMTRQSDGKFIVGGAAVTNSSYQETNQLFLTRYNANGTLDTGFGSNGLLLYSTDAREARDIAFTAAGKILVLGQKPYASNSSIGPTSIFYLMQFNPDGTLDSSFNNGNSLSFGYSYYASIKLDPQNKIYVSGSAYNYNSLYNFKRIIRLNENGSFDSTFGTNGIYDFNGRLYPSDYKSLNNMSFTPDGKMVVGTHVNLPAFTIFVSRLVISPSSLSVSDSPLHSKEIFVYPNPSEDYFTVKSKNTIQTLELTNFLGQSVLKNKNSSTIEVKNIPAGNYFLKVKADNNEKTFKVIKK
nr:T9SS type A sorting domain-containing protein [uncultured Chryseobacterium sp.]